MSKKKVMDETTIHMCKYHAINPEEMTTRMNLKIKENIRVSNDSIENFLLAQDLPGSKIKVLYCFCT